MLERPYKGDMQSPENILYKDFDDRVNTFVQSYLDKYEPCLYDKTKVIHDPRLGDLPVL